MRQLRVAIMLMAVALLLAGCGSSRVVREAGAVQRLRRIQRVADEFVETDLGAVSFVPVLPGVL